SADKRKAVGMLLADDEWSQWNNREIARHIGVGETLVREMKAEAALSRGATIPDDPLSVLVERNGTVYTYTRKVVAQAAPVYVLDDQDFWQLKQAEHHLRKAHEYLGQVGLAVAPMTAALDLLLAEVRAIKPD